MTDRANRQSRPAPARLKGVRLDVEPDRWASTGPIRLASGRGRSFARVRLSGSPDAPCEVQLIRRGPPGAAGFAWAQVHSGELARCERLIDLDRMFGVDAFRPSAADTLSLRAQAGGAALALKVQLFEALASDEAAAPGGPPLSPGQETERLGRLLFDCGRRAEALPRLRAAAAAGSQDPGVWTRLAQALDAAGEPAGAFGAWWRVLVLTGDEDAAARISTLLRCSPRDLARRWPSSEGSPPLRAARRAMDALAFWGGRLDDHAPGAPALGQAVLAQTVDALALLARPIDLNDPDDLARRWSAIGTLSADPNLARLRAAAGGGVIARKAPLPGDSADLNPLAERALRAVDGRAWPTAPSRLVDETLADPSFERPVLICGFHHSGTRLLAQLLQAAGLFQRVDRPSYEWSYVQALNMLLLPGWMSAEAIAAFDPAKAPPVLDRRSIAARLVLAGRRPGGAWGHKDPRTGVTAEAWLQAFPRARIVNLVRNPLDTLGTLSRDYARFTPQGRAPQQDLPFWSGLWSAYLHRTRDAMARAERACEARFEDLCARPAETLTRIAAALDLPGAADPAVLASAPIDGSKVSAHRAWLADGRLSAEAAGCLQGLARANGYPPD